MATDREYRITFTTASGDPCRACQNVANVSPFYYISHTAAVPDRNSFRPHEMCVCQIDVELVQLLPHDDFIVKDLVEASVTVQELSLSTVDHVTNPSFSDTKDVVIEDKKVISTTITANAGVTLQGSLEQFAANAGVSWIETFMGSKSISASVTKTLQPRTYTTVGESLSRMTKHITGTLYRVDEPNQPLGNAHAGYIVQEGSAQFFAEEGNL